MPFSPMEEVIEDIKAGKMVIVCDDEDRENEGDLTMAAELVRPEDINFMATHGRGQICSRHAGGLVGGHQWGPEAIPRLLGHGKADQAPAVSGHEVYVLGSYELGGHGEVALVLAILVIADDYHLPRLDVLDDFFHRAKRHLRRSSQGFSGLFPVAAPGAAPRIWL